jgi:hypothetical protein
MPDWLPAIVAGVSLLAMALGTAGYQWSAWKTGPDRLPENDLGRLHAARQLRRRLQISAMLALVGVLIPLGDFLPVFRTSPRLFVIFWLAVLGMVIWIVLLALGDLASSVAHHRQAQSQLDAERELLKRDIRRFRAGTNGHHGE